MEQAEISFAKDISNAKKAMEGRLLRANELKISVEAKLGSAEDKLKRVTEMLEGLRDKSSANLKLLGQTRSQLADKKMLVMDLNHQVFLRVEYICFFVSSFFIPD